MDLFETQPFVKADPPRFGRRYEAKVPNEENFLLKDLVRLDALELTRKQVGARISEVGCQGSCADNRTIMELDRTRTRLGGREAAAAFADQPLHQ